MEQIRLLACLTVIAVAALPIPASAWNMPGHMLSAAIAYQVLRQENPPAIEKVKAILEKHSWYATQWEARLQDVPIPYNGLVLFMQAASGRMNFVSRTSNITGTVALHQLAVQTRGATSYRSNQRTRHCEHPDRVGRE
jgi:hypothetical protein